MRAGLGTLGVLFLAALGCGGKSGGGAGGSGGADGGVGGNGGSALPTAPATASAFCAQSDALQKARLVQCYGGTAADWPIFFGPSPCPTLDAAVAEHRLTYDASMAPACLGQLAQPVTCSGKWPADACASVLVGAVATGEPCDSVYVCPQHSNCTATSAVLVDSCAPPTCQHIPALGETCDDYVCQDGLSCVGGVCLANLKAGAACGKNNQANCGENLFCAMSDSSPTCKPMVEGGPCLPNEGCFDFQYCDSTKHCHARLGLGADCSGDASSCQTFTACDETTHRCVAASHLGQQCGNLIGINFLCEGGTCLADADQVGHCATPVNIGDACTKDFECAPGTCTDGICKAQLPNDGADCTDPTIQCTSGLCTAGICVAPAADGADCTLKEECMSGACVGAKCVPQAANGAACTLPEECMSGLCAGGTCAAKAANGATCVDGSTCDTGHCAAGTCAACPMTTSP